LGHSGRREIRFARANVLQVICLFAAFKCFPAEDSKLILISRHASGALVVYDVTKRESYVRAEKWIQELKEKAPKNIIVYLIGNKIDLVEERTVSTEEGKELAEVFQLEFIETSAKENINVAQTFMGFGLYSSSIFHHLILSFSAQRIANEKNDTDTTDDSVIPVDNLPPKSSSNCCQ
jgi:hypothetical protein